MNWFYPRVKIYKLSTLDSLNRYRTSAKYWQRFHDRRLMDSGSGGFHSWNMEGNKKNYKRVWRSSRLLSTGSVLWVGGLQIEAGVDSKS